MKTKILLFIILASFVMTIPTSSQTSKKKVWLSGIVTDNAGNPVKGAMILIDKKNTYVVTDDKGFYKVKIRPDAGEITIFTFPGVIEKVMIKGQTELNITLNSSRNAEENQAVADNKVDFGYEKIEKEDVSSQVNKLNTDKNKYASYSNVYDMLKGAIPGVQVIGKSIIIQGISSPTMTNEPLFVVNGIIVTSIDDIHPVEVKSIEVLKGAAASIYGSRGANGVILINLKKGPDDYK
ncbi:MAG: TonB-dependent receptor plug domain-containing protein [Bacteroidia bacterium]|nr:TonB-dependent receptor plug domain-containing protein [Bacteroidia bacterium]